MKKSLDAVKQSSLNVEAPSLFQILTKWLELSKVEKKNIHFIRRIMAVDLPITEKDQITFLLDRIIVGEPS